MLWLYTLFIFFVSVSDDDDLHVPDLHKEDRLLSFIFIHSFSFCFSCWGSWQQQAQKVSSDFSIPSHNSS